MVDRAECGRAHACQHSHAVHARSHRSSDTGAHHSQRQSSLEQVSTGTSTECFFLLSLLLKEGCCYSRRLRARGTTVCLTTLHSAMWFTVEVPCSFVRLCILIETRLRDCRHGSSGSRNYVQRRGASLLGHNYVASMGEADVFFFFSFPRKQWAFDAVLGVWNPLASAGLYIAPTRQGFPFLLS